MKTELVSNRLYSFWEKDGRKYYWDDKNNHFFSYYEDKWIVSKQIPDSQFKYLTLFFKKGYTEVSQDVRDMVVRYARAEIESKVEDIDKQIERIEVQKLLDKTCQERKNWENQQKSKL